MVSQYPVSMPKLSMHLLWQHGVCKLHENCSCCSRIGYGLGIQTRDSLRILFHGFAKDNNLLTKGRKVVISGLDGDLVSTAAIAGKTLAEMAATLPTTNLPIAFPTVWRN